MGLVVSVILMVAISLYDKSPRPEFASKSTEELEAADKLEVTEEN